MSQPTDQASQGAAAAQGGHRLREGGEVGEVAGGMAPAIGGAVGGPISTASARSKHQRLGFLIDEDCAFDSDPAFDGDPADSGWVSPPVIGE